MSPAVAGGFFTTEPPGRPKFNFLIWEFKTIYWSLVRLQFVFSSVQLLSRVQLLRMPGFLVHHQLLEFAQTHVH